MSTTVSNNYAIGYDFPVTGEVFYVNVVNGTTGISGVNDAIVSSISIVINQSGPSLVYNIAFKNPTLGSAQVPASSLYPDVDTALNAYRSLVLQY